MNAPALIPPSALARKPRVQPSRLSKDARAAIAAEAAEVDLYDRPSTRADCLPGGVNAERPCPWVSCRHHVYLSVSPLGGIYSQDVGPDELHLLADTCALDVAERGGDLVVGRVERNAGVRVAHGIPPDRGRVGRSGSW